MKIPKTTISASCSKRLQTEDGKLPGPKTLTIRTKNFSDIPEFTFADLPGREEYPEENLRSFNSLGYKFYHDRHVTDLKIFGRADLMILCLIINVLL